MNRTDTTRGPRAPDPDRAAADGEPLAMARALVAVPSVNPGMAGDEAHAGEGRAAELCARWLESWGFRVELVEAAPGRPSVVARRGGEGPSLLLSGHLDTVGVEAMSVAPFEPVIREGRLYGRGSCDMKGGVAAILAAARRLALDGEPAGRLTVALTCDEEHASIGLLDLLASGLTADAAVVAEPTSLAVMPANKGFLWIRALVRGVAAHGSRPDVGRDAIRAAGRLLDALDLYEELAAAGEPHPLLGRSTIHAGTIRGGTAPSVYPDRCELVLEARTLPGEDAGTVMDRLGRVLERARDRDPDLDVELQAELYRPGSELPPGSDPIPPLEAALEAEGEPVRVEGMTAWVEAAFLNEAGTPAVCFGPGSIEKAHSADEFVPVDEVERAARVLHRFARGFLRGGGRDDVGSGATRAGRKGEE